MSETGLYTAEQVLARSRSRSAKLVASEVADRISRHPAVLDTRIEEGSSGPEVVVAVKTPYSPLLVGRRRRRLPNGMWVVEVNRYETDYLYSEIFERHAYVKHGVSLSSGAMVVDIGANIGMFGLFVHSAVPSARVLAFEPIPDLAAIASANLRAHGAHAEVVPSAVSDSTGRREIVYYARSSVFSGVLADEDRDDETLRAIVRNAVARELEGSDPADLERWVAQFMKGRLEGTRLTVPSVRLDEALLDRDIRRIDLLKIDAERSEGAILSSLPADMWERIRQVVVEVHGEDCQEIVTATLEAAGYRVSWAADDELAGSGLQTAFAVRTGRPSLARRSGSNQAVSPEPIEPSQIYRWLETDGFGAAMAVPIAIIDGGDGDLVSPAAWAGPALRMNRNHQQASQMTAGLRETAGHWFSVTGIMPASPADRFDECGGDSLAAVRVLSRIAKQTMIELPIDCLGPSTTLAQFERTCADAASRRRPPSTPPSETSHDDLSAAQLGMWRLQESCPDSSTYNVPVAFDIGGGVDVELLTDAIGLLRERHRALRTTFPVINGTTPTRQLVEDREWAVDRIEMRDMSLALATMTEVALLPFDLKNEPPFRAMVIRITDNRHLLLMVLHHIICDGWSLQVLLRDLGELYRALQNGDVPGLPPMPAAGIPDHYRLEAQASMADSPSGRYWTQKLLPVPPRVELPADHPRPQVRRGVGAREPFRLGRRLTSRVRRLASQEGVTPFVVLLSAYKVLLLRYTGNADITVGVPLANRHGPDEENVVDLLSNLAALRTRLDGNPSVRDLLARVNTTTREALANQRVPFERVLELVSVPRSPGRTPLFQVAMTMQDGAERDLKLDRPISEPIDVHTGTAKFDLALFLLDEGNDVAGYIEYDRDLFDAPTVRRMRDHLWRIIERFEVPTCLVGDLEFLGEGEVQSIDQRSGRVRSESASEFQLWEVVSEWSRRQPTALAVKQGPTTLTYQQLVSSARVLVPRLLDLGAKPGRVIGIAMERSPASIVSVLSVLMSGSAFLPLDPSAPPERLLHMTEDAQPLCVIADGSARAKLIESSIPLIAPGDMSVHAGWDRHTPPRTAPNDLAYVIYTSGSTGVPKGVEIEHCGLRNLIEETARALVIGPGSRVLQYVSPSFDASVWETLMTLTSGGLLCLGPAGPMDADLDLVGVIREEGVSIAFLPPALLALVDPLEVPSIRTIVTGGDRVPHSLVNRWVGHARVVAAYGPTEATIIQSWHECSSALSSDAPLGTVIPNVSWHVLDDRLQRCAVGVPGEICIGGVAVGRGYRNRPAMTAARFVPDPYGPEGGRLYRTGDIGRWSEDGSLRFLGRHDRQIKVRGFRVEPGEIEAAVRSHSAIEDAVVVVDDSTRGRRLRCIAKLRPNAVPIGVEDLKQYAKRLLPSYLVPHEITLVDHLPLTLNGKIDRKALQRGSESSEERLADLVARIETMTDQEVAAFLARDALQDDANG